MRARKLLFAGAVCWHLLRADLAIAEVCDKVVPTWNFSNGPITVYEEIQPALASLGLIFLAYLAILVLFWKVADVKRVPFLFLFGGIISILAVALDAVAYLFYRFDPSENQVYEFALQEGCLTGHNSTAYVWATAAILQIVAYFLVRTHFSKLAVPD